MERIKNNIFFNLSNTMLKIIGLVCMTIDHLYLYVFANTTINVSIFRIVGRIAAPLFLFAVIQAMRYSSDKKVIFSDCINIIYVFAFLKLFYRIYYIRRSHLM